MTVEELAIFECVLTLSKWRSIAMWQFDCEEIILSGINTDDRREVLPFAVECRKEWILSKSN